MTGRTAIAIADILHDYWSNEVQHEAADMLRNQHEELLRMTKERTHIYNLLAIIHRDGGQYASEHGIEKACDDAGAQVATWLETINSVDALCEQARLAEREACADLCDLLDASSPKRIAEAIRSRGNP